MQKKEKLGKLSGRLSVPFPKKLGSAGVNIEVRPSNAMSSSPLAVISFLKKDTGEITPGCQKTLYFNEESLCLQASSTPNTHGVAGISTIGFSDWLITTVVERHAEFLDHDYRSLNEFVSMSVKDFSELVNVMHPTSVAILSAARNLCMRSHIITMSEKYAEGIGGADLSPEDVAILWAHRIVAEVMES